MTRCGGSWRNCSACQAHRSKTREIILQPLPIGKGLEGAGDDAEHEGGRTAIMVRKHASDVRWLRGFDLQVQSSVQVEQTRSQVAHPFGCLAALQALESSEVGHRAFCKSEEQKQPP